MLTAAVSHQSAELGDGLVDVGCRKRVLDKNRRCNSVRPLYCGSPWRERKQCSRFQTRDNSLQKNKNKINLSKSKAGLFKKIEIYMTVTKNNYYKFMML